MASLEENHRFWNHDYDWSRYAGDEWSARWGGADVQWSWTLLPRIRSYLPADTILEIGPGHGRWTHFLKEHCSRLILVDLAENCIEACRSRFRTATHLEYHVNDGKGLEMIAADSVDFVFSFESLVHAEAPVIESYLGQLARKLRKGGTGFVHHSNLGEYPLYFALTGRLPRSVRRRLKKAGRLDYNEWRAPSVTAELFARWAREAGLACIGQELINWGGHRLIDCLTTFSKDRVGQPEAPRLLRNPDFMDEAYQVQHLSVLYGQGVPW